MATTWPAPLSWAKTALTLKVIARWMKAAQLHTTDEGFAKAEQMLGVADLFNPQDPHHQRSQGQGAVRQGCELHRARREAVIVMSSTGNAGSLLEDGQHQAIEAKRPCPSNRKHRLASITYQNFPALSPLGW